MNDRLAKLEDLVDTLRGPDGCPWDREQTLGDLRSYLIEEAHELAAAIDGGEPSEIKSELGDLLFQMVFLARLIDEGGGSGALPKALEEALDTVHQKMIDRHPHVFGGPPLKSSRDVARAWQERKLVEGSDSVLAGVPLSAPALVGAFRMSQKAADAGFDWPEADSVMSKVEEEVLEVREAMKQASPESIDEEIGDLLFSVANLARKLGIDPEACLARANSKFRDRFQDIEDRLETGTRVSDLSSGELATHWDLAKKRTQRRGR